MPVYTENGVFLGNLSNVKFDDYTAKSIQINDVWITFSRVIAVGDAVIVSKAQPYPIGQPTKENFVTKQTLKRAVKEQSLIRLTLSLPPFSMD